MADLPPPVTSLLPHRGPMRLLDEAVEITQVRALCRGTVRPDNPFLKEGWLDPQVHIELIAQASAAFVSATDPLHRRIQGYLVAARNVDLAEVDVPVGAVLLVEVVEAARIGDFASFDGVVTWEGREVARGNVKVFKAGEDPS